MTDTDRLLGEFIDAWVAGRRPDVDAYLERADPTQREVLEEGIDAFLDTAPLPRYDEEQLRALREDPAVRAFSESAAWSSVVPRLRRRAGVDTRSLATALRRALGWDEAAERKAQAYLDDLEAGRVPADRISRRVLAVLADALRVPAAALDAASATARPSGALLWRRTEDPDQAEVARDLDILSAALSSAPPRAPDDVDRAFTGGRDA